MDLVLRKVEEEMFEAGNGGRENAEKVVILLSDGGQTYRHLNRDEVNPEPIAKVKCKRNYTPTGTWIFCFNQCD